jgi:hypothetical protein
MINHANKLQVDSSTSKKSGFALSPPFPTPATGAFGDAQAAEGFSFSGAATSPPVFRFAGAPALVATPAGGAFGFGGTPAGGASASGAEEGVPARKIFKATMRSRAWC